MSSAPNRTRMARISNLEAKMLEELEALDKKSEGYLTRAAERRANARTQKVKGRINAAKDALRSALVAERLADSINSSKVRLHSNMTTLSDRAHKLLLRSLPEELTRGMENTSPDVNANNNTLERIYSRKYGFENYNSSSAAAAAHEERLAAAIAANEENAAAANAIGEGEGVCDKLGRCVRMARNGVFHFFTRKNNTKKEGGAKKGKKGKKGKSMKRSRRN